MRWRDRARTRASELVLAAAMIGAAATAIATYGEFNHTYDEGVHLQAGLEWIERGTFTLEAKQPPLARVAIAIGPWLDGTLLSKVPYEKESSLYVAGNDVLYRGDYHRTLTLARLGILPFLLACVALAWAWGRRAAGRGAAAVAAVLCAAAPPLIGHGALATLDVAAAATLAAALLAWDRLRCERTRRRAIQLGVALALTLLAKISAFVIAPVAMAAVWAARRWLAGPEPPPPTHATTDEPVAESIARSGSAGPRSNAQRCGELIARWRAAGFALLALFAVVWFGYRWSVGPIRPADDAHRRELVGALDTCAGHGAMRSLLDAVIDIPIPAPELPRGVLAACAHNAHGHANIYLGQPRMHGSWSFFPVVLATKTPPALLLLAAVGLATAIAAARRRQRAAVWVPIAAVAGVLVSVMLSQINIGLRHVLVVYPLLAAVAGAGAVWLWGARRRRLGRAAAAVLVASTVTSAALAHPDHIAYYNALAGDHPERIAIATDLDWGQDLERLAAVLRAHDAPQVSLAYFGSADPCAHGLPPVYNLPAGVRATGWVAVSEMRRFGASSAHLWSPRCRARPPPGTRRIGGRYTWLDDLVPVARAGRSIRVYFIPPE
jgi:hypothetical protein